MADEVDSAYWRKRKLKIANPRCSYTTTRVLKRQAL